jgi:hypothetical protein
LLFSIAWPRRNSIGGWSDEYFYPLLALQLQKVGA